MSNLLIALLTRIYGIHTKSTSKLGIPVIISALLILLYSSINGISIDGLLYYLFFIESVGKSQLWIFLILGFLRLNDVADQIDVVLKYPRVSTPSQEEGNSLEDQNDILDAIIDEINPDEEIVIGNEWESADTMFRKNIDKVVDIVEDADRTHCLMFRSVDRMTRAEIFESAIFLYKMQEEGVLLYFDDLGFIDFSTSLQKLVLMVKVMNAREEYLNIQTRGEEGRKSSIENDEWPAGAPYGYEKVEDEESNELKVSSLESKIIQRGYELVELMGDTESVNVKQVHETLEMEFGEDDTPSYDTFRTILRKRMYTGVMTFDGKELGQCPQIIPEELFEKVQSILPDRNNESTNEFLDHALKRVIDKFGTDASLDLFEEVIKGKCPQCGSDVKPWGSETRKGKRVKAYRCVNHPDLRSEDADEEDLDDEETCDFEGPLLTTKFMDQWDSTIPLVCISCHQPLDDSEWEKSPNKIGFIEQTCDFCGTTVCTDLSEDKYERMGEVPSILHFFSDKSSEKSSSEREDNENSAISGGSNDGNGVESDENMDIRDFC